MPSEQQCNDFDKRLVEHEKHLDVVQRDFHNHIREVRADLSDHIKEQADRHNELLESQRLNTDAITALTLSTQGLVDAWQAANATVKVASAIGRAFKWFAGIALIGGSLVTLIKSGGLHL